MLYYYVVDLRDKPGLDKALPSKRISKRTEHHSMVLFFCCVIAVDGPNALAVVTTSNELAIKIERWEPTESARVWIIEQQLLGEDALSLRAAVWALRGTD